MYIIQNKRKKGSREYIYSFLAESRWNKEKRRSEKVIIANISKLPTETIESLKHYLKKETNTVLLKDIVVEKSIDYGYFFIIFKIMERLHVKKALESAFPKEEKENVKYALLMIIGKIITRGSKLGIVNWIKRNREVGKVLGFSESELNKLTEKQLYLHQFDLNNLQNKIQRKWNVYHKPRCKKIYLYDITSFYFEGTENELAMYGYNRDKKQGKKIVTAGLVTDEKGFPLKIELFKGNTKDETTLQAQIESLKNEFGATEIILVGDRGMKIRYNLENIENENQGYTDGISYITGLTVSEIENLEKEGVVQMGLFDKDLSEVEREGKRYILCVNPELKAEKQNLRDIFKNKFELELLNIQRNFERERKRCESNRAKIASGHKNKNLKTELRKEEIETWQYKIRKAQEKYKMKTVYKVEMHTKSGKENFSVQYDMLAYEALGKYDGKYVFETTVTKDELSATEVRETYKKLQNVEHAFRDMKQSRLNLRPIFHRKEETTRAHAFLGMFSYAVIHEMESLIFPWLQEEKRNKKGPRNQWSFNDVAEELKMIKLCILSFGDSQYQKIQITQLNEHQKIILDILGIDETFLKDMINFS